MWFLEVEFFILLLLVVLGAIVVRTSFLFACRNKSESGVAPRAVTVSIDGSARLPVRDYVSEKQGLAGRPDAVIIEEKNYIPVERKPLAKKIRDRHVAQLLVYMRLIEEFEGKRPPYGYLVLGPKCRRVKIYNTEKRQAWLQRQLNNMRLILAGQKATPTPQKNKCKRCRVRGRCSYAAAVDNAAKASA